MKQLFIIFISLTFSFQLLAQNTTTVFINNKKAARAISNPEKTDAVLLIKKSKYKKYKPFIIVVAGEYIGSEMYKCSLEIPDYNSSIIEEIKNKPGHFNLSDPKTVKLLLAGKTLSLYLLINPSNPLMAMPSRRVFLGNVIMK